MSFTKRKPRLKQKLSPVRETLFYKIAAAMVILALLWVIFAPGSGLVTIWRKRAELESLQQQNVLIEEANVRLQKDIDRLQNDPAYLEELARREHNLLRKNERVFEFAPKKPAKE